MADADASQDRRTRYWQRERAQKALGGLRGGQASTPKAGRLLRRQLGEYERRPRKDWGLERLARKVSQMEGLAWYRGACGSWAQSIASRWRKRAELDKFSA